MDAKEKVNSIHTREKKCRENDNYIVRKENYMNKIKFMVSLQFETKVFQQISFNAQQKKKNLLI